MPHLITLTTDFGLRDPFVATMKGQILGRLPEARIIDVTHDISTYCPDEAGFWLSRAFPYFPVATVHVAVVDPGVGTERSILLVEVDGHVFLAPDNGLLSAVITRAVAASVYSLNLARAAVRCGLLSPSATFHGRDIFAPIAAELAAGRVTIAELGDPVNTFVQTRTAEPRKEEGEIVGQVISTDHFGNLITNIDGSLVAESASAVVGLNERAIPIRRTYGDATAGQTIALVNSFGVLEIAVVEGSAARLLGTTRGTEVRIRPA